MCVAVGRQKEGSSFIQPCVVFIARVGEIIKSSLQHPTNDHFARNTVGKAQILAL